MLANGQGKGRAKAGGGLRDRPDCKELVLSSGELTIGDHIGSTGRRVRGGQDVRIINIPVEAGANLGLFENLHEFPDGDAFSRQLQSASNLYFGTPIRAFIRNLAGNWDRISAQVRQYRREFVSTVIAGKDDVTGEVRRAAGRFALVAFAGEFARQLDILPIAEGEAEKASKLLFEKWCSRRGTFGAMDEERAIRQVRLFIEQHGTSRFDRQRSPTTETQEKVINRAGFYRDGQYWFLLQLFRTEVCKGFDHLMVLKALSKRGSAYEAEEDGVTRYDPKRSLGPGTRPVRVYIIYGAILEGE